MPRNELPAEGKFQKKLDRDERLYDVTQRMKIKRSEDYDVLEEVFDKPTLMTLYHLINKGVIDRLYGVVKSGKEARIYRGLNKSGRELAVKIYLVASAEFRKGMLQYIEGDRRFGKVKRDSRNLIYTWALKEFKNLEKAYSVGVRVPQPYAVENNVLVMEFIGSNGIPAPLLREAELHDPSRVYKKLLEYVKILYRDASLVHGDLSGFNVMVVNDEPVIFDLSQAVLLTHPMASQLLYRDLVNLANFFKHLGVEVEPVEVTYIWVTGSKPNFTLTGS
ncbi:MAG: serine protein kinase RIO [Candidatus Bathyarchaeia archaeon]